MRLIPVAVLLLVVAGCAPGMPGVRPVDPLSVAERAFVAEARAAGLAGPDTDGQVVASGRQICGSVKPRAQIVRDAVALGVPAEAIEPSIALAVKHLCPTKVFTPDGPVTAFQDGTFLVGEEIVPGRYRTAGPTARALPNCYWARLRGTSGEFADVIANGNVKGPTTVTIAASDVAFKSNGCAGWTKTG